MDLIRRKLNLIDSQLARKDDFHKHFIATCPTLFLTIGLILGILIQNLTPLPVYLWLTLLAVFAITTIIFFIIQYSNNSAKPQNNNQTIIAYTALLCFTCLGAIRLFTFTNPAPTDIRNFITDQRQLATIRGIITTEPRINKNYQWQFAKFKHSDPASKFYLKLTEVKTTTGWAKTTGTLYINVAEPILDLKPLYNR